MKTAAIAFAWLALCTTASVGAGLPTPPVEALIDDLTSVDSSTPGIDDTGMYDAFLAEDASPRFKAGVLPVHPPTVPPAMRELVRLGAAALPALLAHLDDARPTHLTVGTELDPLETFGGQFYADEYDARGRKAPAKDCMSNVSCRLFEHPYRIKIGDICEVLIGQIVNRRLYAARYQPSAIVVVNSPLEVPALALRIRRDWSGVGGRALEASLLSDLRSARGLEGWHGYGDALRRLRFYYPRAYAGLTGADLGKRKAFESAP